jgi:phosphate:Na+ symporter
MTAMFIQLPGGIGLFLLGMLLLSDGLKAAAGETLKRILVQFTARPPKAFVSGVVVTSLVQSSSATTLATIGFVSAGLLTFAQAVGVVIGGSVGTTTTGWLVTLLGLKLSVGKLAMPLVGVGAFLRLSLKGRPAMLGLALAGFGLIFVGIEVLQTGMGGLAERVRPDLLPAGSPAGRGVLVLAGVAMTVIMQSSSAAIATVVTAYHAGTMNLDQALSLVIGASIGTTVTAALASLGASVPARRTALAHIVFNTFAGSLAFLAQPLFVLAVRHWTDRSGNAPDAVVLALFHTLFNLLGAMIVLPGVARFSRLIIRLVPDRGPALTRHLDNSLIEVPEVAIEAVRRTLGDALRELLTGVRRQLAAFHHHAPPDLAPVREALHQARGFLGRVPPSLHVPNRPNARLAVVHAGDHLDQLAEELAQSPPGASRWTDPRVLQARTRLETLLNAAEQCLNGAAAAALLETLKSGATELAELRRSGRETILDETARGSLSPETASELLDALRWLDAIAYHTWRIVHYLCAAAGHGSEPEAAPAAPAGSAGQAGGRRN